MKVGARRLVYFVNVLAASGVLAGLANCGGGERPQVSEDPLPDASKPIETEGGATSSVTVVGYDGDAGILFGDNGFVSCGSTASEKTITLKNNTSDVVSFTAAMISGDKYYKLNPASGGIPLRGQTTIQITPQPIPQESDVANDLYSGTLQIKFENGDPPINIRLHQTAQGAIIKSSIGPQIDFGNVKVNTAASQVLTLSNLGNAEVTAELSVGTQEFTVDGAASASAKLGSTGTTSKTIAFKPTALQAYSDQLSITFNSSAVFCKAPPTSIALKGSGTSSVTVTPGTLDFGQTSCGTAGTYQTVTITTTIDGSFTPTLAGGNTKYTLADSNGNTLNVGNPVPLTATVPYQLRVVPKQVPIPSSVADNALGDTLTITTTTPGDQPHTIGLKQTARGAILAVSPASVTNNGTVDQVFNNSLSVVNTGNAPADFTLAVTDLQPTPVQAGAAFDLNKTSGSAQVGSTPVNLQVTLPSTFNSTQLAKLQLGTAPGAVLCQDLPGKYPLQAATGAGTSITVNPGSLNFGQVSCGTTAPYQELTLKSIQDVDVTPTLGKGAPSPFTLADDTGTALTLGTPIHLTANVAKKIRVVPKQVPVPSSTADNALADTLTLTSPLAAPDDKKTIALSETAYGAVFKFTPLSLKGANNTKFNFTLSNDGNASGAFTLASTAGALSQAPSTLAAKSSFSGELTKTGPGNISVTSSATLCAELPAPITVSD